MDIKVSTSSGDLVNMDLVRMGKETIALTDAVLRKASAEELFHRMGFLIFPNHWTTFVGMIS